MSREERFFILFLKMILFGIGIGAIIETIRQFVKLL